MIPNRSTLRIADLKRHGSTDARFISARIPSHAHDAIGELAAKFGATRTEVLVALLNAGLEVAQRRKSKRG